jgi:hypothetical protein
VTPGALPSEESEAAPDDGGVTGSVTGAAEPRSGIIGRIEDLLSAE